MKKLICALLCIMMLLPLFGCNKQTQETGVTYTYRQAISSTPANFNPHDLSADGAFMVLGYTSMGFVGVGMDENKDFVRTYEMADSIEDITAGFAQKEKYGIADGEKNRVWQIKLNQNAKWENGDIINADTLVIVKDAVKTIEEVYA